MSVLTRFLDAAAMLALLSPVFGAEWLCDLEAAKAKAAAEGKAVLVDFTGSDWCGWCIRLRREVLDTPEFEAYAKDKFVFLEVDIPRNTPGFDPELLRRNQEICRQYGVNSFPSVLVLTPTGQLAGGFTGGRTSVGEVMALLDAALANVLALRDAESLQGEEKLWALRRLCLRMPGTPGARLREELARLDAENITGIHDELRAGAQMAELQSRLAEATRQGQDTSVKLQLVQDSLARACPQNLVALLQLQLELQLPLARTAEDAAAIRQTLLRLAEADPAHASQYQDMLRQLLGPRKAQPSP